MPERPLVAQSGRVQDHLPRPLSKVEQTWAAGAGLQNWIAQDLAALLGKSVVVINGRYAGSEKWIKPLVLADGGL